MDTAQITVGKHYYVSGMTEPVEVTAGHEDGSFTVRSINLFNEAIQWGLTPDMFKGEAEPTQSKKPALPVFPTEVTKQLVKIDKPMVLGCFVDWSAVDGAWEVTSARTGETIYIKPGGYVRPHDGPPYSEQAVQHATRCIDAIKAVV